MTLDEYDDDDELPALEVLLGNTYSLPVGVNSTQQLVSDEEWELLKAYLSDIRRGKEKSDRFEAYQHSKSALGKMTAGFSYGGLPEKIGEELVNLITTTFVIDSALIFDVFLPESILFLLRHREGLTHAEAHKRMANPPADPDKRLAFDKAGEHMRKK